MVHYQFTCYEYHYVGTVTMAEQTVYRNELHEWWIIKLCGVLSQDCFLSINALLKSHLVICFYS